MAATTVSAFLSSISYIYSEFKNIIPVVHPLVLLSVADHHARSISRNSHKRVIGVLLGQDNGKTINVANSFGIPFEEDEKDSKTWFLDHNYIEGMYEMFKKVNGVFSPCLFPHPKSDMVTDSLHQCVKG